MFKQSFSQLYNRAREFGLKTIPKFLGNVHSGLMKAKPMITNVNHVIQGLHEGAQKSPHVSQETKANLLKVAGISDKYTKHFHTVANKADVIKDVLLAGA